MATYGGSLQCAGTSIGMHRHICAFFDGPDEDHRVLGSFYRDGFDRGGKTTHIVADENREEYLRRPADAGIDVQRATKTGQPEVLSWTDMYVREHPFDQDAMLASVEEISNRVPVAATRVPSWSGIIWIGCSSTKRP